jgi:pyruvate carboxylase
VFDSLNYIENLELGIDAVKKAGGVAEAAISYTGDVSDPHPKLYNLDYYLDLTAKLVGAGIHVLAIKDMAGLLKPKAATLLIGSIRKKYPDLVIHVHTHDTAGTGVASMIACAEAGADVVDAAIDSMSGLTSQPSMGAIVNSLAGTRLDTGLNVDYIYSLNAYWEQIRLLYSPFDPNVKSSDSGVYLHEMPGGQYTNLLFQSQQLGLGAQWQEIKKSYAIANKLCGNITKVTPSSKVVGDFAQFLVSQKLTEQDVHDNAETLSFPQSVLEYFQGYLGQPPYGFLEPLRTRILEARRLPSIQGRPGASMPAMDLENLRITLEDAYGSERIRDTDVLSAALYPKVYEEFRKTMDKYGDLSTLPTKFFLTPLQVGQEFSFEFEKGKTLIVKLVAIGPLHEDTGNRDAYFSLNGEARVVSVLDIVTNKHIGESKNLSIRPKADQKEKGDVAAPMVVFIDIRVEL